MKSIETLEKCIASIYGEKKSPEDIEALAKIQEHIKALKEESAKEEKATIELAEKYRDSLLKGGSFPPTEGQKRNEDDSDPVSFEDVLADFLKKGQN